MRYSHQIISKRRQNKDRLLDRTAGRWNSCGGSVLRCLPGTGRTIKSEKPKISNKRIDSKRISSYNMICCQEVSDTGGCGGMADAQDSKSCGGDLVWVQVPPSAVKGAKPDLGFAPFCTV